MLQKKGANFVHNSLVSNAKIFNEIQKCCKNGGGYSYKDNIRGIKIPFVVQIYSFILSKRVRLVSYELSLSQMLLGREGGVFLIRRIVIYVCVWGGHDYLQYI